MRHQRRGRVGPRGHRRHRRHRSTDDETGAVDLVASQFKSNEYRENLDKGYFLIFFKKLRLSPVT